MVEEGFPEQLVLCTLLCCARVKLGSDADWLIDTQNKTPCFISNLQDTFFPAHTQEADCVVTKDELNKMCYGLQVSI